MFQCGQMRKLRHGNEGRLAQDHAASQSRAGTWAKASDNLNFHTWEAVMR